MNGYIRFFLLATFIGAILLIVVLQFNAGRSINNLIGSNQRMLHDFDVKADLNELRGNIVILESKVRGLVISGYLEDTEYLQPELDEISKVLSQLDKGRFDANIHPLLAVLDTLVTEKIKFDQQVLDTLRFRGKTAAEIMINSGNGVHISDSLSAVIREIDTVHRLKLTSLIERADANGKKARNIGTLMAVIAVLASVFTFSYALLKVNQQQKLIGLLNISEQKALRAGQAKENFLSNMSHEIRTPLNAILGFANLLSQKELDKESERYVDTIRNAGGNLLTIINDVLDSSKIEAGMMRIESVPFNLNELVNSVEMMFRQRADGNVLKFEVTIDAAVPGMLLGDPVRLTQILVNILSNAFKFTAAGEISLAVQKLKEENKTATISFCIQDTGIGIEADKIDMVFERFRQAEDSVTRKYGGTGLGLSIVKELVELQNGTIAVTSIPGRGTTFHITIPYSTEAVREPVKPEAADRKNRHLTGIKVLVAEDNEINQSLLRHIFNKWGLSSTFVHNGVESLEELGKNEYQCILMDIQMPAMDGYTATREIRRKLQLRTPVIAMTAHIMAGEREKCLSYGMDDYISKPIDENLLYDLIVRYAGQEEAADDVAEEKGSQHPAGDRDHFQFIDLTYMNDIARDNIDYKKEATALFIEAVPEELDVIQMALNENRLEEFRGLVHNYKTTISVMGLNKALAPLLELLENEATNRNDLPELLKEVMAYSRHALVEARTFQSSLYSA